MKNLFRHLGKTDENTENYEEVYADWDADEDPYQNTEFVEEDGYYEADEEPVEEGGYYEDDTYYDDDSCYEESGYYEDGAYYEEYYEENAGYDDIDTYDATDEKTSSGHGFPAWLRQLSAMDKVLYASGVCVLILAVVLGVVFLNSRSTSDQYKQFAQVGVQLDGIEVIGDQGLLAVADATLARIEAAKLLEDKPTDYTEADYSKNATVVLKMVSVQKDLKIKFTNKSSGKLISNVPFSVTVTTADKKTETWSDDDMDGIIYKKGITPGTYKVTVNALSGEKYTGYTLPAATESVEVRKDIAYKKIDVSDEVKTESQIDVSKEEQKKQEPAVESTLQDTVEWVESTAVTSTYVEVSRSHIPDPQTIAKAGTFYRMSKKITLNHTSATLKIGGKGLTLTASHSLKNIVSTGWSSSDSAVAGVDADGVVTAVSAGTAVITCTVTVTEDGEDVDYTADCQITVEEEAPFGGSISVSPAVVALNEGKTETVQITTSGFDAGRELEYTAESDDAGVAKASVDKKGKVTITAVEEGVATIEVRANYKEDALVDPPVAEISVTVSAQGTISLDKTTVTAYKGGTVTIKATVKNADSITAKSSDKSVATVAVDGKSILITGVKKGTATITVSTEDGSSATCAVTVKDGAQNDTKSLLKDKDGNPLYVQENDSYREAVYADYYKDSVKFFKKGETRYTGWQTLDGNVYFFDASGTKVTGEQVIQGAKYNFGSDGALIKGSGTMGIDVSKHNGNIDWNAVKNSGVSYVIIRCGYRGYTQGSLVIDPKFHDNIKGATAAGLKVGVYFFSQAVDEVEAVQEASFVLDAVKGYKISYPVFLDVEYSGASGNSGRADKLDKATRTAVCKAFCATIRSGGYSAGVYANKTWLESMLDPSSLSSCKIWLAQYAATPSYKGKYDMWQYKSTGKVSGISGNVDMNLSYMSF